MKQFTFINRFVRCLLLAILVAALSPVSSGAQSKFEKAYGDTSNEYGRYAITTSQGGYAMAGYVQRTSTTNDMYFIEVDSCGNFIRDRRIGGTKDEEAQVITKNNSGDYVMAGYTKSYGFGQSDAYVVRLNSPGLNTAVGYPFGDSLQEAAEYMTIMNSGNYALTGGTNSLTSGGYDVFFARVTAAGALTTFRSYGGSGDDRGYSIRQTSDGGFIIAGGTQSFGAGSSDFYLLKINSTGGLTWTKTFGGPKYDEAYDVKQTLDGGYILVGKTRDRDSTGTSKDDIYIVKTTSSGALSWAKVYGGTDNESGESVIQLSDSSYVVAGYTKSYGHGDYDAYLLKLNKAGGLVWSRTYGGNKEDKAYSVEKTSDNGFVLCGHTKSFGSGGFDFYLIKTDNNGHTGCDSSGAKSYSPPDSVSSGGSAKLGGQITSNVKIDSASVYQDTACGNCHSLKLIQASTSNKNLYVYPNPSSDEINVTFVGNLEGKLGILIYDQLGSVVYNKQGIDASWILERYTINTAFLSEGIYTIQLRTEQGIFSRLFLISK